MKGNSKAAFRVMGMQAKTKMSEFWNESGYWLKTMLAIVIPVLLVLFGEWVYSARGSWGFGGEMLVAIVAGVFYIGYRWYRKTYDNCSLDIPVPETPFIEHDASNELVSVEQKRIEELLLYVDELECWFRDNGYFTEYENVSEKQSEDI